MSGVVDSACANIIRSGEPIVRLPSVGDGETRRSRSRALAALVDQALDRMTPGAYGRPMRTAARRRLVRVIARIGTFALLAVAALVAVAGPVAAECNPPGPDASFRRAVPFASRVVIGTVVEVRPDGVHPLGDEGPSSRFTLAVAEVLRGEAPVRLRLERLETGNCMRWLAVRTGDEIALALDVRQTEPALARNTAAWIRGEHYLGAFETMTIADVHELVRVAAPDTATAPEDGEGAGPTLVSSVIATLVVTAAATVGWTRLREASGA